MLVTQDTKISYPETVNTDVEIWREATAYRTALATSGPRDLARYTIREGGNPQSKAPEPESQKEETLQTTSNCDKVAESENDAESNLIDLNISMKYYKVFFR